MTDIPPCGELMYLPPMHCTKPAGHEQRGDPNHGTEMIPEPLSGVAASMISERDRLIRERDEFMEWRAGEIRKLQIWSWAGFVAVGASVGALIVNVINH